MPALIIDNYDSFTYNLVHAVAEITTCAPIVVRNDELNWDEVQRLDIDAVIISPGPGRPDNPRDFGMSARLIAEATVPLLGVCLGHQGIAQHFGGSVVRAAEPVHGRGAEIFHDGDELFAGVPNPFTAIRYHSLLVDESLPDCLRKIAWTPDGLIMALRHVERPIWGVQFHPESICTEYGTTILRNFLKAPKRSSQYAVRSTPASRSRMKMQARQRQLTVAPETLFRGLFSHQRHAFWLDSSLVTPHSRFSFMGASGEVLRHDCLAGGFFEHMEQLLESEVHAPPLPFDFTGGYVGYLGYELKAECGSPNLHRSSLPDAFLLRVDQFLAIDHSENAVWLVGRDAEWLDETEQRIRALQDGSTGPWFCPAPSCELGISRDEYLRLIAECRSRIAAGESYEICLTNQLRVATDIPALAYYEVLRRQNPAPHSAYLQFGEIQVACSSPERFLRVDPVGNVESRPIKGTIRRGATEQEDAQFRAALAASEKNRAENLMIVDLARNDLGRVCRFGSVHVPRMMEVESYATVHQLVSTISGRLNADASAVDCLRAAFPGGSMTGAPKLRTLEILDELEPEARGIYSGSIGYLGFNGATDLNIVIRTAVFHAGVASIGVGGAITFQSNPEEEWDEMLLKAQALLRAFSGTLS
ncbi:MAG TPA: aminodeoxychorismate synthase component I [Bryobacteraceae bacterium]|nr:aminodeoxychorismate synthase component I [Bryobacteraceae bacterium]